MVVRTALPLVVRVLVALAATYIAGCTDQATQALPSSSEFEFEVLGVRPYPDAVFGLTYAFAHGFTRVDVNGSTYRQASPGIVFRTTQQQPLPIYKVVLDQRSSNWLPTALQHPFSKGTIRLVDRAGDNVLAKFTLPTDRWPGDQAGAWLARLLNPDPSGSQGRQFDVSSVAQVNVLTPSSVLQPAETATKGLRVIDCPTVVSYVGGASDYGHGELRTPNWTLGLPYSLREVHCSRRGVLLIGSHRQEDLELIAIDEAGVVVARGFVRNDKFDLRRYHHTKVISTDDLGDRLVLRQAHFVPSSPHTALAAHEVNFVIPWSAIRLPR